MYMKHNLAADIVDLFDDFRAEKGIEIPCSDPDEEAERHDDGNCACLYGMEYADLIDKVVYILTSREGENA